MDFCTWLCLDPTTSPVHFLHHQVHDALAHMMIASSLPVLQPLCVLPVIRKHSISVGEDRPGARERNARRKFRAAVLPHYYYCCYYYHCMVGRRGLVGRQGRPVLRAVLEGAAEGKVKRCETAASTGSRPLPVSREGPRRLLLL